MFCKSSLRPLSLGLVAGYAGGKGAPHFNHDAVA
jgi:hypothetical protein